MEFRVRVRNKFSKGIFSKGELIKPEVGKGEKPCSSLVVALFAYWIGMG
ncbi:hypothetical protein GvMRE_Ic2g39 [endosymbiont GvMRE of Glomus versiforme]|nr:hypothetical protein GvMRE_Ic2g39 [endosymbiont GvMRE of Glomus versiforme]